MTDTTTTTDPAALPWPHAEQPPALPWQYRRDGQPRQPEDQDEDPLVAYTVMRSAFTGERWHVSTVFLGIDASLGFADRPQLWETHVHGGPQDRAQWRHDSEAAAMSHHGELVGYLAGLLVLPPELQDAAEQGTADVQAIPS